MSGGDDKKKFSVRFSRLTGGEYRVVAWPLDDDGR